MNPRQLSLVIWIGVAFVIGLAMSGIRSSIFSTLRTVLNPALLIPAALSAGWTAAVVYGLYHLGLWSPSLWWDTLVFTLVGTTALVLRMSQSKDFSRGYYARIALQGLGFSVLLGTFVSTYTFGLPVELLLVPWLVLLGGVQAMASSSEEYAPAAKPVKVLIVLTWLALLFRAVSGAIADHEGFLRLLTVQSLLLLFVLTVAYLPYLFLLRLWMTYELAFTPLQLGEDKRFVRLYARARTILRCRLNLSRLEQFRRGPGNHLRGATTRAAVDQVFEEAKRSG